VLLLAARILTIRGGGLVLLRPQRALARALELIAADQLIQIREGTDVTPGAEREAG